MRKQIIAIALLSSAAGVQSVSANSPYLDRIDTVRNQITADKFNHNKQVKNEFDQFKNESIIPTINELQDNYKDHKTVDWNRLNQRYKISLMYYAAAQLKGKKQVGDINNFDLSSMNKEDANKIKRMYQFAGILQATQEIIKLANKDYKQQDTPRSDRYRKELYNNGISYQRDLLSALENNNNTKTPLEKYITRITQLQQRTRYTDKNTPVVATTWEDAYNNLVDNTKQYAIELGDINISKNMNITRIPQNQYYKCKLVYDEGDKPQNDSSWSYLNIFNCNT